METQSLLIPKLRKLVQDAIDKCMYDSAQFFATELVSLSEDASDKFELAQIYFLTKQYNRAVHFLETHKLLNEPRYKYLAGRCKAECELWQECLQVLGPEVSEKVVLSAPKKVIEFEISLQSSMSLLRGRAFEALENRLHATFCYKQALQHNIFCYEAFDALIGGHMLSSEEELALIESLNFDKDTEWLNQLYRSKLKKYHPQTKQLALSDLPHPSNNIEYQVAKAEAYFYSNHFQAAYDLTKKIMTQDPFAQGSILSLYISCMVELKLKSQLFNFSHQMVDLYPTKPIAWYSVGCYYFLLESYDEARQYFNKSTSCGSHFGPGWLGYGHAFALKAEHDQALAAYRSAHRILVGSHLPPLCIGVESVRANDLTIANQFLLKARDICSSDPLVHHELGVVQYKNANYAEAIKTFSFALSLLDENNLSMWVPWEPTVFNLAQCYWKIGDYPKAAEQYMKALELQPENSTSWTALGFVTHMMGETDLAIEHYHRALGINPDDTIAEVMLGKALKEFSEPQTTAPKFPPLSDQFESSLELTCEESNNSLSLNFSMSQDTQDTPDTIPRGMGETKYRPNVVPFQGYQSNSEDDMEAD